MSRLPPARIHLLPLLAVALTACSSLPDLGLHLLKRTYLNPVLGRDFPDPAVLRAPDGWFFAYATQSGFGDRTLNIQVARSPDLVQWELLGDALPGKPRWAAAKQKFWAPQVIHDPLQDKYFMYYSAEPDGVQGKCLAVATANTPYGPFIDSGEPLLCGAGIEHIDPMAFDDPKTGRRLLYWGSGSSPIKVRELASDRVRFLPQSTPKEIVFPDASKAYSSLIEGAWVIFRDGFYYLFYSGDRCCTSDPSYAVMVARATDALGPFELFGSAILERNDSWLAPGHNSIVTDDEGNEWMLYHAIRADRANSEDRPRVMLLERVVYRDGWPRVSGNQPSVGSQVAPALKPFAATR